MSATSPGHDWSDDLLAVEQDEAVRARWAAVRRWAWRGTKLLIALAVPLFLLAAVVCGGCFMRFPCRSMQSEAKGNLKAIYVAEESYRAEHGRYTTDARAMGFEAKGAKRRYSFFVRTSEDGQHFEAVSVGRQDPRVVGDVWRIDPRNHLHNVVNACAR